MAKRCRTAKGRFRKCGGGASKKSSSKKGRCTRWSKGRKRCLKRAR